MHWLVKLILYDLLGSQPLSGILYVGAAIIFGIIVWLIAHFIIFSIAAAIFIKQENSHFEYAIRRDWTKAIIHCFIGCLLSAEIVACYQLGLLSNLTYYIPLWVVFLFICTLALIRSAPFRKRAALIRKLNRAIKAK